MTYNVFGGTLNLAQLMRSAYTIIMHRPRDYLGWLWLTGTTSLLLSVNLPAWALSKLSIKHSCLKVHVVRGISASSRRQSTAYCQEFMCNNCAIILYMVSVHIYLKACNHRSVLHAIIARNNCR